MAPALSQRAPTLTVALLCVMALAVPARFHRWADWLQDKISILAAPISQPLVLAGAWLRGSGTSMTDEAQLAYEEKIGFLESELLRQRQENARLTQVIRDLQSGLEMVKDQPVRVLQAGVFGYATEARSPVLRVQAGSRQGVTPQSFAIAPGLQVVGRVVASAERTCTLKPITARGGEALAGVVILSQGNPDGLRCTLSPTGEGTLRGPVEDRRDPATSGAIEPVVGQTVRLDDPTWPKAARMLVLGRVERVEPSPDQPLRRVITVRPTVAGLDRLSEVVLWTPIMGEEAPP